MSDHKKQIDRSLKQLAITAQRYPPKTKQRQQALTSLIIELRNSGGLTRPYLGEFRGFYEDIYAEALQRLFLYICEEIERYNPELEVLQWTNFLLKKRFFIEASREVMPTSPRGLQLKQIKRVTIDVLDKNNPPEVKSSGKYSLSEELLECIKEDQEGLFKNTYVTKKPNANFQFITLQILSGYSWKEISAQLDIKISTLSCFYQRCLIKFAPKFKEYLANE